MQEAVPVVCRACGGYMMISGSVTYVGSVVLSGRTLTDRRSMALWTLSKREYGVLISMQNNKYSNLQVARAPCHAARLGY